MKKWARILRKSFKSTLHLPAWTPNTWVHNPNGGALQNLEEFIIRLHQGAAKKMVDSPDAVAPKVGRRVLNSDAIKLKQMGVEVVEAKKLKKAFLTKMNTKLRSTTKGTTCIGIHGRDEMSVAMHGQARSGIWCECQNHLWHTTNQT